MNELKIFEKEEFGKVRVQMINGEPMFCAKDIASALRYSDTSDAISTHCKSGKKVYHQHANGVGGVNMIYIPESDVYRLIMRSKLPSAEKFQDWVCEEVIPSIRKTGSYSIKSQIAIPDFSNPAEAARAWADEFEAKQKALAEAKDAKDNVNRLIHDAKTYTSGEIAKELGLKSAIELNNILRDNNVQFKQNGTWLLYAKYSDMKYTSTKQIVLDNGRIQYDRRWTGIGRDFVVNFIQKIL